ncbi:MAG TPA: hypothetical protein VFD92_04585 [Candidatus Binatia bacterium]|nr:hypothetical protein [Candidatus Binatia bacterium]
MLLITGADVRAIHDTGRDDAALAPFLAVTDAFDDAYLASAGLTNAVRKQVQAFLTLHWTYVADVGVHSSLRVDDVTETFTSSKKEPGLRDSNFGRTAILLDSSGVLREVSDTRPKAEIEIFGRPCAPCAPAAKPVEFDIELPSINTMPPGPLTLYLGPGGWSSSEDDVWTPATYAGSIVAMFGTVDQNPGAGGVAYTLRRAPSGQVGSDQTIATTIANSVRDFGVDGSVSYNAGDRYAVKVVLGTGVPGMNMNLTLRFRRG